MALNVSFEVLDLRHFASSSLRGLYEMESELWRSRLSWDFTPSTRLLRQYLDSRLLPGFVFLESGRVTGYAFYVYEENKAVIGDVFAAPREPGDLRTASMVENTLLRHVCETLQNTPHVERVESQLLLHPAGAHAQAFDEAGFRRYRRLFLVKPVKAPPSKPRIELPAPLALRLWRESDLSTAGRLIVESYRSHPDGVINDQYRTERGAQRFLHNIVRYAGCGAFAQQHSCIVENLATQESVGLLLSSRVSPECGHVTQVCVHPNYRKMGLARAMLAMSTESHLREGVAEISLTVTEANAGAVELYLSDGFELRQSFDGAVWVRGRRG